jgi:hypothetical protein
LIDFAVLLFDLLLGLAVLTSASEKSKGFNPARPKENAINLVFGMER